MRMRRFPGGRNLKKLVFAAMGLLAAILWSADQAGAQEELYKIQPGDQLAVSVLEDPNLNQTVLVRPDGRITLPIAGSVRAEGLSPEQLQEVLRQRFARGFEITPTVTVSLRYIAARDEVVDAEDVATVFVIGQVARPGALELTRPTNLLQALALAGGPGRFAKLDGIQLRRHDEDGTETEVMTFDYERIEDGMAALGNVLVKDGDVIVVPERGLFD
ncbi:polysaccharide export outer membrane protein [Oceanicella actignis]|nr:polysaccharide export outer membrane protein [Oceanicella actignis]